MRKSHKFNSFCNAFVPAKNGESIHFCRHLCTIFGPFSFTLKNDTLREESFAANAINKNRRKMEKMVIGQVT